MDETQGKAGTAADWDDSIILALGGNLAIGESSIAQTLKAALEALSVRGVRLEARSRFWRSAAWPDPNAPAYLNAVAAVATALGPAALLETLHEVEAAFGRRRGEANAPRTLDLDLIAYGRALRQADPVLPHPRAAERLFVMGPLAEIAPRWRHPLSGETAAALAARARVGCDARPLEGEADQPPFA